MGGGNRFYRHFVHFLYVTFKIEFNMNDLFNIDSSIYFI